MKALDCYMVSELLRTSIIKLAAKVVGSGLQEPECNSLLLIKIKMYLKFIYSNNSIIVQLNYVIYIFIILSLFNISR